VFLEKGPVLAKQKYFLILKSKENGIDKGPVVLYERKEKILARTHDYNFVTTGRFNCFWRRFGFKPFYLFYFLRKKLIFL
jgi:hypothetical protein